MSNKTFYRAIDFDKLDWNKLTSAKYPYSGENFSFGIGGIHFVNGPGWQLTIYNEDGSSDVFELPKILSDLLDYQEKRGMEKKQQEIKNSFRSLLGLDI